MMMMMMMVMMMIIIIITMTKNFNRRCSHGHHAQHTANWHNTHMHMDCTHSLTHLHQSQHSYNIVRSARAAITQNYNNDDDADDDDDDDDADDNNNNNNLNSQLDSQLPNVGADLDGTVGGPRISAHGIVLALVPGPQHPADPVLR